MIQELPTSFQILMGGSLLLLFIYMIHRVKQEPSRLNLARKKSLEGPSPEPARESTTRKRKQKFSEAKALNILFKFEENEYDAYEILGLPAGSSWKDCQEAYPLIVKTPLVIVAYETLEKTLNKKL